MAKERFLTCIVCPRGCQMRVELGNSGEVIKVEGNFCKRGLVYANDECTNPKRTITSTVRCRSGAVIPVKTDRTVPKEKMFDVMAEINSVIAEDGLKIGDIIIRDVCGTGANVIATANSK